MDSVQLSIEDVAEVSGVKNSVASVCRRLGVCCAKDVLEVDIGADMPWLEAQGLSYMDVRRLQNAARRLGGSGRLAAGAPAADRRREVHHSASAEGGAVSPPGSSSGLRQEEEEERADYFDPSPAAPQPGRASSAAASADEGKTCGSFSWQILGRRGGAGGGPLPPSTATSRSLAFFGPDSGPEALARQGGGGGGPTNSTRSSACFGPESGSVPPGCASAISTRSSACCEAGGRQPLADGGATRSSACCEARGQQPFAGGGATRSLASGCVLPGAAPCTEAAPPRASRPSSTPPLTPEAGARPAKPLAEQRRSPVPPADGVPPPPTGGSVPGAPPPLTAANVGRHLDGARPKAPCCGASAASSSTATAAARRSTRLDDRISAAQRLKAAAAPAARKRGWVAAAAGAERSLLDLRREWVRRCADGGGAAAARPAFDVRGAVAASGVFPAAPRGNQASNAERRGGAANPGEEGEAQSVSSSRSTQAKRARLAEGPAEEQPCLFFDEAHPHLSPFSPHPVTIDSATYPTAMHYVRALAFAGTPYADMLRRIPEPAAMLTAAARLGAKAEVGGGGCVWAPLRRATAEKYRQHPRLRGPLCATGRAALVYSSPDPVLGGGAGGANCVGRALCDARELCLSGGLPRFDGSPPRVETRMCTVCDCRPQSGGSTWCDRCLAHAEAGAVRSSAVPKPLPSAAAACSACCEAPAVPGYMWCEACYSRERRQVYQGHISHT
ncbi:N-glycosidase YbiA [Diplonema papillatum]|nr:N-glycosidase YbiA [Diplonema papillatum]